MVSSASDQPNRPSTSTQEEKPRVRRSEAATISLRVGWVLAAAFVISLILAATPAALFDPGWYARWIGALIGNGDLALVGLALMVLSEGLMGSRRLPVGRRQTLLQPLRWLRRVALLVALGYFALVPLLSFTAWSQLKTRQQNLGQSLTTMAQVVQAVAKAQDPAQVANALRDWPDRSLELPVPRLDVPFPSQRNQLVAVLSGRQAELAAHRSQGDQALLLDQLAPWSRNAASALLLGSFYWLVGARFGQGSRSSRSSSRSGGLEPRSGIPNQGDSNAHPSADAVK